MPAYAQSIKSHLVLAFLFSHLPEAAQITDLAKRNWTPSLILEVMNKSVESVAGDMPCSSIERYKLYFITGAAFNVLIQWLKSGAIESPHEMAKACAGFMYGDTIAKLE